MPDRGMGLYYEEDGHGQVVVFLHGFLESVTMWHYLSLDHLKVRKICIDLPGHGRSPVCDELPPQISHVARKVIATMDELGVQEYSIVGHSMGGYVALELKQIDKRVRKVILLNSNSWSDPEEKKQDRRRVAEIVFSMKSLFLKEAIPNLFLDPSKNQKESDDLINEAQYMTPDAIAYASLAMAERRDHTDLIAASPDDFVIIQGAGDKLVVREKADALYTGLLKNYFVIDGAGHMAHIEKPEKVMRILLETFQ